MPPVKRPTIPLPKGWKPLVRSAVLHVISLAHFSIVRARARVARSGNMRVRLNAENDRLKQEVALLREEVRIKDARMACIPPQRRPHYAATERMAILELRAARGWSLKQTAIELLVTASSIASWMKRLGEAGPETLVQTAAPVNKFPDFVRYTVQRLKVLCPSMGKLRLAQTLCRAGLQLSATSVGRILKEPPSPEPVSKAKAGGQAVTAKRSNHVWHVDLMVVPTSAGFWSAWTPCALPQGWPFCWWVAVALDHHSRRVMGFAVFAECPKSKDVCAFLGRAMRYAGCVPKYIICDKGKQFWCSAFKRWCRRKRIKPRFGQVGKHGSIAVIERFFLTLKTECTRRILVPLRRESFRRELRLYSQWYNTHRPHSTLGAKTPEEVYRNAPSDHEPPRIDPMCDERITCSVQFHAGRKHLPMITLKQAA
ncbi:MAG: transposase [Planctomycetes bacterium]|nr:transposase [Planctomycetota bacterium]